MIYVYDNNSTDRSTELARASGAVAGREQRQGKGHVVRRMFRYVEADVYMVDDGDVTYRAASAGKPVAEVTDNGFDMVVGAGGGQHGAVINDRKQTEPIDGR